eukprot:s992_g5.t1
MTHAKHKTKGSPALAFLKQKLTDILSQLVGQHVFVAQSRGSGFAPKLAVALLRIDKMQTKVQIQSHHGRSVALLEMCKVRGEISTKEIGDPQNCLRRESRCGYGLVEVLLVLRCCHK